MLLRYNLAHKDRHVAGGVDLLDRSLVGAALVHRDLVQIPIRFDGLFEKAFRLGDVALCCQLEANGLALLVDSGLEESSYVHDLDVRLIHSPATTDWGLVFQGDLLAKRRKMKKERVVLSTHNIES